MSNAIATTEERPAALTPVSESAAIIQVIERAALNPNVDIEKMERLLQMQERIMDKQAEVAFTNAMRTAKLSMPPVFKDSKNTHTHSRYAKLETISKAVDPIIHANGFTLSFGTDQSALPSHYGITCEVSHVDGFKKLFRADVPSDAAGAKGASNKNLTQAFGSTMTYGRRYLKCMIFDIQVTDEDDDGNSAGGSGGHDIFPGDLPNDPPMKSSAQLKREGAWQRVIDDLNADLQDCHSIVTLSKLRENYRERVRSEGWNRSYTHQLAEVFTQAEERLTFNPLEAG